MSNENEVVQAVKRAFDDARILAMKNTVAARIPECGDFGAIAQNLDWAITNLDDYTAAVTAKAVAEKDAEIAGLRGALAVCQAKYEAADADRRAQAAAPVAAVPDGWQLVPKEPNEMMLRPDGFTHRLWYSQYKAMLAVAPQHPGAEQSSDRSRANGNEAAHHQCPRDTPYGPATCGKCLEGAAQAQPIAGELPPLPQFNVTYADHSYPAYNKKAMTTYGHQCRAAVLERAADEIQDFSPAASAMVRALNKTEG